MTGNPVSDHNPTQLRTGVEKSARSDGVRGDGVESRG